MLQNVQWDAHEWDVDDAEDVVRLEICHSNDGNILSPGGDKVFPN